jgi:16S rRNA (guanine966-N2)-methyltransferase
VAGRSGGRRIDVPGGTATRPTSDRVREAIFNSLASTGSIVGARVLDAFAGSGALGLEALSRGAAHATFVETSPAARSVIAENLAALDLGERATLLGGDGAAVAATGGPWDLVLLDPPYAFDGWPDLLTAVHAALAPGGTIVVESDRDLEVPAGLDVLRSRRYGGTVVAFVTSTGADS